MELGDIPVSVGQATPPLVVTDEAEEAPFVDLDGLRLRRRGDRLAVELDVTSADRTLWLRSLVRPVTVGTAVTASCGGLLDGFWRGEVEPDPVRQPALAAARRGDPVVVPYFDVGFPVHLLRGRATEGGTVAAYLLNGSVAQVWQVALPAVRPVCAAALAAILEWGPEGETRELLRGIGDPAGLLGLHGPDEDAPGAGASWR
jgi:hypothetical protein